MNRLGPALNASSTAVERFNTRLENLAQQGAANVNYALENTARLLEVVGERAEASAQNTAAFDRYNALVGGWVSENMGFSNLADWEAQVRMMGAAAETVINALVAEGYTLEEKRRRASSMRTCAILSRRQSTLSVVPKRQPMGLLVFGSLPRALRTPPGD
jgi:hypothetical protein